jgi:hypothetical protein
MKISTLCLPSGACLSFALIAIPNEPVQAQSCCPVIAQSTISPAKPTPSDTIRIFTSISTTLHAEPACIEIVEVSVPPNTVGITFVYATNSLMPANETHIDTFIIEPLPVGVFTVHLSVSLVHSKVDCIQYTKNTSVFTFTVSSPVTELANIKVPGDLKVYPNPFNDFLNIGSDAEIYNSAGQSMLVNYISDGVVDTSRWPRGVYSVRNKSGSGKVIK